jgi:hypothetical protein
VTAEHDPLLLMDVDGVLNPYPACPEGFSEYDFFPQDDEPVRLAAVHREWLHELAASFEMVWTSGWGDEANEYLCPHVGLPELPTIAFPSLPSEPAAKVPAIAAFVVDRAVAWVDYLLTPEARTWARERSYPTLLVDVDHEIGLTRDAVDALLAWRLGLG